MSNGTNKSGKTKAGATAQPAPQIALQNASGKTAKQLAYEQMTLAEAEALGQQLASKKYADYNKQGLNARNPTQRLVTELDMNAKPVVLDDATFNKLAKDQDLIVLYRGVSAAPSLTAKEVADQTMYGDKTYVGDGIHGNGLYFSTDNSTAKAYSGRSRDVNQSAVMKAAIDPSKARIIKEDDLNAMARADKDLQTNGSFDWSKFNRAYRDPANYAIKKGYNVIHVPGGNSSYAYNKKNKTGEDYYVPIDRSALIFSANVTPGR